MERAAAETTIKANPVFEGTGKKLFATNIHFAMHDSEKRFSRLNILFFLASFPCARSISKHAVDIRSIPLVRSALNTDTLQI